MPRLPIPPKLYPAPRMGGFQASPKREPPLRARQIDGEGRPVVRGALDGDPSAVVLGHVPHYRQAQPRSAGGLRARFVHAVEALEDAWDLTLRYADARVGDAHDYLRVLRAPDHLDPPTGRRVFDGIIHKISEHGGELGFVAVDGVPGGFTEALPLQGDVFLAGDAAHAGEHAHQYAAHVYEGGVVGTFLAFEACQVEEVRYEVGEPLGLLPELRGKQACLDRVFVEGFFQAFCQQFQARRRGL